MESEDLSSSFIDELKRTGCSGVQVHGIVPNDLLLEAFKRASVKGLMEKLGIYKTTDALKTDLYAETQRFHIVDHEQYQLFATVFGLELNTNEVNTVNRCRPTAELHPLPLADFEAHLGSKNKGIGHYLLQHSEDILKLARSLLDQPKEQRL